MLFILVKYNETEIATESKHIVRSQNNVKVLWIQSNIII